MRRGSIIEGLKQETELALCFFSSEPDDIKHLLLDIPTVNTNRTSTDFRTVEHDVICVGQCVTRVCSKC